MTDKVLVSMILINGQVVLTECQATPDENGFFTLINPVRPVIIENTIEFVAFNSFSDSTHYKVHFDKIISIGEMHFQYIDKYIESVERIDKEVLSKYEELMKPEKSSSSIYVDNESNSIN